MSLSTKQRDTFNLFLSSLEKAGNKSELFKSIKTGCKRAAWDYVTGYSNGGQLATEVHEGTNISPAHIKTTKHQPEAALLHPHTELKCSQAINSVSSPPCPVPT